jgi:pentatricopeptide repeat protein
VAAAVEACTRAGSVGEALALCEEMVGEGAGSPVIQGMMVTLAWYVALRCVDSCIHVCPSILGGGLTLLTY